MLGVWCYVRLPQILEIVIVRGGAAALYLRENAPTRRHAEDEVGTRRCHEAELRREDHLLIEPKLVSQESRHDGLDLAAVRTVNMDSVDVICRRKKMTLQFLGEWIDDLELGSLAVS